MPIPRIARTISLLLASLTVVASGQERSVTPLERQYRAAADSLINGALADSAAGQRLAEMVDRFGHRLSGSASLERAIDWILLEMERDSLDNVRGERVMVPRWVRGEESVELVEPRPAKLPMLGLGGSIATPAEGITAEVLVVGSFDELQARAAAARGKIVLFDVPFTTYGQTVAYRQTGAIAAARAGAVASLIRSVASSSMRTPHTGSMRYDSSVTMPRYRCRVAASMVTLGIERVSR